LLPPLFVLTVVSLLDDLKNVPANARLGAHVAAAVMGVALLGWPRLGLPFGIGVVLSVLWLVGMINTYNFMDGINGHTAFQTVITAVASALLVARTGHTDWTLPLLYLLVAGAAAGFLPYNFPRARMFMGDVGSVPLGGALGLLALWSARETDGALLVPLALLQFNFILEMSVTLARRAWRGEDLSEPHREHLYERFAAATGSHARAVLVENSVLLPLSVLLTFFNSASAPMKSMIAASVVIVWMVHYAAVDGFCRRRGWQFRTAT
jgi:UDP-N-acetylmuramyl pentapeptide phosphotransferase/UDP-N-acetylglucosamine-1-phosphate transferase